MQPEMCKIKEMAHLSNSCSAHAETKKITQNHERRRDKGSTDFELS